MLRLPFCPPRAGLALALCATVVGACGSASATDQAKASVKTFLTAAAKGDGPKACNELTADARRLLESATSARCEQVIRELGSRTAPKQRAEIGAIEPSVSIHGATASATYTGVSGGRQRRTVTLQKVGGAWKISQLPTIG